MGKANFHQIVAQAQAALGDSPLAIKLSTYCDQYTPGGNYAGMIVYHSYGQYQWKQRESQGCAGGFKGRTFYVLILRTDDWPDEYRRRAGQGMVHDHIYQKYFDMSFTRNKTCCGGFAVMRGETKYSSIWLNKTSDLIGKLPWISDGSQYLSDAERMVVDCAVQAWKQHGAGHVCAAPQLNSMPRGNSLAGNERAPQAGNQPAPQRSRPLGSRLGGFLLGVWRAIIS